MKRVLYSIPVFILLLPWMFISTVILAVSILVTPYSALLLAPVAVVLAAAFYVHNQRSRHGQHGIAALGASTVLAAPLVCIVVAFFTHGQDMAARQYNDAGGVEAFGALQTAVTP